MLFLLVLSEKEIVFLLIRILLSLSMSILILDVLCLRFPPCCAPSLPLSKWPCFLSFRIISLSSFLLICPMSTPLSMSFLAMSSYPLRLPISRLLFVPMSISKNMKMKKLSLKLSKPQKRLLLLQMVLLLLILLLPDSDSRPGLFLANPLLGAAALLGGTSLLGGIMNTVSQNSANALNQENFREQMKFAQYQYENSKQYNSARSQVARLRAAGLNPVLAMQGGAQAGQISGVATPSANPQQAVDYSGIMNGAASLGTSLFEGSLTGSKEAKNYADAAKGVADAAKSQAETLRTGVGTAQDRVTLDIMNQTKNALVRNAYNEVRLQELQAESIGLQNTFKEICNGFLPTQLWSDIENTIADTELKLEQKKIGWLQARAAMKSAVAAYRESCKQQGFYLTDYQSDRLIRATTDHVLSQSYKNWLTPGYSSSIKLPFGGGGSVTNPLPEGERRARSVYRKASTE